MNTVTKIELVQSLDSMNVTQEDLDEWSEYVKDGLAAEYPYAEIKVKQGSQYALHVENSQCYDPDDDLEQVVQDHISRLWDKWNQEFPV